MHPECLQALRNPRYHIDITKITQQLQNTLVSGHLSMHCMEHATKQVDVGLRAPNECCHACVISCIPVSVNDRALGWLRMDIGISPNLPMYIAQCYSPKFGDLFLQYIFLSILMSRDCFTMVRWLVVSIEVLFTEANSCKEALPDQAKCGTTKTGYSPRSTFQDVVSSPFTKPLFACISACQCMSHVNISPRLFL